MQTQGRATAFTGFYKVPRMFRLIEGGGAGGADPNPLTRTTLEGAFNTVVKVLGGESVFWAP